MAGAPSNDSLATDCPSTFGKANCGSCEPNGNLSLNLSLSMINYLSLKTIPKCYHPKSSNTKQNWLFANQAPHIARKAESYAERLEFL
jgi:hypothetical protein